MQRIELRSHGYTAWILPERGASCVRLSRFGAEALRTPENDDCYRQNEFLWGTPILFLPNRISGGCFEFEGRMYRLPVNEPDTGCFLHGTLHRTAFSVVGSDISMDAEPYPGEPVWSFREDDQSEKSVILRYEATEEKPYLTFPHPFEVTVAWTLGEDGLRQRVTITNHSPLNMPVALAFHTTFRIPFAKESRPENVVLMLDTVKEYGRNMRTFLPDGRVWEEYPDQNEMERGVYLPSEHNISRLFRMGGRHEMCLTDRRSGVRVRYAVGETCGYWMVYNGGNQDLLCVEPQSWLSNCPNAPFPRETSGFDFIGPDEARIYETKMSIEHCGSCGV